MEEKKEIWDTLKTQEQEIIEFAKDKDKISFQDILNFLEVKKTKKEKYHPGILKSISRNIRTLMNCYLIEDSKKNIFDFDDSFKLTQLGKDSILSDEQKLINEKERIENYISYMKESVAREQKALKEIDKKIISNKKGGE